MLKDETRSSRVSHEAKVHAAQTIILRELLFMPAARFIELQKTTGLESDHVKFHIARLVELGYIVKNDQSYMLTSAGKEYANKLDTDNNQIERQPKSAIILVIENEAGDLLVQERLKHPYFGFWGFAGGKIRWGETIIEAAARELKEETGLEATLVYKGVYHELTKSKETHEVLEDKIFHVVYGSQPTGNLVERFEGGHNEWLSQAVLSTIDKKYKSFAIELSVGKGEQAFIEAEQVYDKEEF
ncbi:MAG TPA: NUDIX hydrolase [Candidatus Microsaccharimonas sp.]|jgi:ADP-ribose pyrophosphatase YjhB (NUDIX family)